MHAVPVPNPPQPSPHDPVGLGLVGIASIILGWSLKLITTAFRANRPKEPQPHPLSAVTEATFGLFAKRTDEGLQELSRLFHSHEDTTDRIEASLEDLKSKFKIHTQVAFQAQEERIQIIEHAMDEFLREQRKANRRFDERLGNLEPPRGPVT